MASKTDSDLVPTHQVVLVGGNPLPVVVAARALAPERLYLLGTAEVLQRSTLDEIRRILGAAVDVREVLIANSASEEISEQYTKACIDLSRREAKAPIPVGLHYTGGTKAMVAGAVRAAVEADLRHHWITYLAAEPHPELHFARGIPPIRVDDVDLTLDDIASLHGTQFEAASRQGSAPTLCSEQKSTLLPGTLKGRHRRHLAESIGSYLFGNAETGTPRFATGEAAIAQWRRFVPPLRFGRVSDSSITVDLRSIMRRLQSNDARPMYQDFAWLKDIGPMGDAANHQGIPAPAIEVESLHLDSTTPDDARSTVLEVDALRIDERASRAWRKDGAFGSWTCAAFPPEVRADLDDQSGLADLFTTSKGKRYTNPELAKVVKYLNDLWFEEWIEGRLRKLFEKFPSRGTGAASEAWEVLRGVEVRKRGNLGTDSDPDRMELDVISRVGHVATVWSCTTSGRASESKLKALEVSVRSAQLAGDHARHVIAFWGDSHQLQQLYRELSRHWEGPDRLRVLGFRHYQGESEFTHYSKHGPEQESLEELFRSWILTPSLRDRYHEGP